MEETTERSSPRIALQRDDLPTLGRPTMQKRTGSSAGDSGPAAGRIFKSLSTMESIFGN